jgi:hypothetical protein
MNRANFSGAPCCFLVSLVTVILPFVFTAAARGDVLSVSLSPLSNVAAGSTGDSFDVLLTNTSGPAVPIEGFFFEVLSSTPDVTLTDATTATTGAAYIFGVDSVFGPDIIGPGSTAADLSASDLDASGAISLASGATVALGHVVFNVSPTALAQIVDLTLAGFPGTSLSDDLGNNVAVSILAGNQFTINTSATVVPEPSPTILILSITCLLLFAGGRKSRR